MNAAEVLAHYETALAAEQTWLAENQDILESHLALPYGMPQIKTNPDGTSYTYDHSVSLRYPLPSNLIIREMLSNITRGDSPEATEISATILKSAIQHIDPVNTSKTPELTLENAKDETGRCPDAELTFAFGTAQVLEMSLADDLTSEYHQELMSVYHTPQGQAVLLRKQSFCSTAILLEPLGLAAPGAPEIILPRGTLTGVTADYDAVQKMKTGEAEGPGDMILRTFEIDTKHLFIKPHRLSAWAYDDQLDRAMLSLIRYSESGPFFYADDWEEYGDIEPRHIDQAAQRIMELCGVTA